MISTEIKTKPKSWASLLAPSVPAPVQKPAVVQNKPVPIPPKAIPAPQIRLRLNIDEDNKFILHIDNFPKKLDYQIAYLLNKNLPSLSYFFIKSGGNNIQPNSDNATVKIKLFFRSIKQAEDAKRILSSLNNFWDDDVSMAKPENIPKPFDKANIIVDENLFNTNIPVGESNPEMINYHYIWFKLNKSQDGFDDISNDIHLQILDEIIYKYSYSSCNAFWESISKADQQAIVDDEYQFIKRKLAELFPDIKIIKVPTITYQLIGYLYIESLTPANVTKKLAYFEKDDEKKYYSFNVDEIDKIENLKDNIEKHTQLDFIKQGIIDTNNLFLTFIKPSVLPSLLREVNPFDVHLDIFTDILTQIKTSGKMNMVKLSDTVLEPRFSVILKQCLYIECGFIYDYENKIYINNRKKNLLLLFRGHSGYIESTLKPDRVHSLSYNTSILNGLFNETTGDKNVGANTYEYYAPDNNKAYYVINKFFFRDNSIEDKIFYIPPVHPFLALLSRGEMWHARTKIAKDYKDVKKKGRAKFPSGVSMIERTIPEILISDFNFTDFEMEYQNIVTNKKVLIHHLYKKYMKYKSKYLVLKSILNK